jgi:hypothetical protein
VEERLKGKRTLGRRRKQLQEDGKEKKEEILKFESGNTRIRLALVQPGPAARIQLNK